jgi:hypothetical protein
MNRYPIWKYTIIVIALVVGFLYTLPNFFGEAPAVQVSSAKVTIKVDDSTKLRVEEILKAAGLTADFVTLDNTSVKARFGNTETQLKAKDAIQKALIPDAANAGYIVALNLLSRSPVWLTSLHAFPMYLGLDLRGGVHFMLQVRMCPTPSRVAGGESINCYSVTAGTHRRACSTIPPNARRAAILSVSTPPRSLPSGRNPPMCTCNRPSATRDRSGVICRTTAIPPSTR